MFSPAFFQSFLVSLLPSFILHFSQFCLNFRCLNLSYYETIDKRTKLALEGCTNVYTYLALFMDKALSSAFFLGSLACYDPWDHKESDMTFQLNNNNKWWPGFLWILHLNWLSFFNIYLIVSLTYCISMLLQ